MAQLLFGGTILLAIWVWWTLYIVDEQPTVSISLLLRVQQGENYLGPFLSQLCQLFRHSTQISLQDVWILTKDDGEQALRIVQRWDAKYPLFHFQAGIEPEQLDLAQVNGQVVVFLDLVNRLTPLTALQAVTQLLANGPTPPGTVVLPTGN